MSPIRRYLSLLLLIFLLPSSHAVECDSCEGKECTKSGCSGDYCISSYSTPRFGSEVDDRILVKGCLSGEMLTRNIKSQCYENEDNEEVCICNKNKCTTTGKKKLKRETIEKVTCACTGGTKNGCNKQGKCKGDLCYWTEQIDLEKVTKGCMDVTVPFLERRSIDSCMLPPMSGSMHALPLNKNTFDKEVLNTESCICSTNNCNKERPFTIPSTKLKKMDSQKCNSTVRAKINGKEYATKQTFCEGEFCYRMKVNVNPSEYYHSEGCATFNPKRKMDPEFGTGECATFKGKSLNVLSCYKTTDEEAMKRLEASIQNEEDEESDEEETEGEDEQIIDDEPQKGKDERTNGKKNEKKEEEEEEKIEKEEEEEEKKKEGNPTPTKHFVWMEPTEAPTPDESNATMITVFVLIILCICVAGITWKFQLHRKLMRANYDTVAGG
uniref:Activin types I and II receptor domain-containing protein n=1 Tax=Pristionchus pacificus TaxID=54126 RepID=A0A8R1U5J1_PRIPA